MAHTGGASNDKVLVSNIEEEESYSLVDLP
jgi:hypothetical protein